MTGPYGMLGWPGAGQSGRTGVNSLLHAPHHEDWH